MNITIDAVRMPEAGRVAIVLDIEALIRISDFSDPCLWTEDEDGNWSTGCGNLFILIDGTPAENQLKFCCYCGKPLTETPYVDPPVEDEP